MTDTRMRVVVVEDHPMYGEGVRATLEGAGDIEVVGATSWC